MAASLTIAACRINDPTCSVSLPLAQKLAERIAKGENVTAASSLRLRRVARLRGLGSLGPDGRAGLKTRRYFNSIVTARGVPATASSLSTVPRGIQRVSFRLYVFVSSLPSCVR